MLQNKIVKAWLAVVVMAAVTLAEEEPVKDAAKAFAEGQALLVQADFDAALDAFRTAAKADTENEEYRQQYAMLRRVVRMRAQLLEQEGSEQWEATAQALRTFYHANGVHTEALPLDRKIHERRKTGGSAAMLAETLLAMDKNAETIEALKSLHKKEQTPRTHVLHGLALAREGHSDEARALEKKTRLKKTAGSRVFFELACLRSRIGDVKGAIKALTRSFELTPPSLLDGTKIDAKACKDLALIAHSPAFAEALETESKIKESKCSQGKGCGKCPNRSKCGEKND